TGSAHLLDNVGDRAVRAKIVTCNGDGGAARMRTRRQLRKHRRFERAPPATVNEHGERRFAVVLGRKKINRPAHRRAVGYPDLRVVRGCSVSRSFTFPAGKYLRMLRHT